jgi:hypothetical protein
MDAEGHLERSSDALSGHRYLWRLVEAMPVRAAGRASGHLGRADERRVTP